MTCRKRNCELLLTMFFAEVHDQLVVRYDVEETRALRADA
jgi:hypothetical protein